MVQLIINGQSDFDVQAFELYQPIDNHHQFKIELSYLQNDHSWKPLMQQGLPIEIALNSDECSSILSFKGIIQNTSFQMNIQHPKLIISGFSPTIKLHDGIQHQSFKKRSPKSIATELLNNYSNCSVAVANNLSTSSKEYAVQYAESTFEYLRRLCAQHNTHFFYTGEKIVLGTLNATDAETINLISGENLAFFNCSLGIGHLGAIVEGYDYVNNKKIQKKISGKESANSDSLLQDLIQQAQKVYKNTPGYISPFSSTEDSIINDSINTVNGNLGNFAVVRGISFEPGLRPGSLIQLEDSELGNVFSNISKNQKFRVIEVTHSMEADNTYQNKFTAIVAAVNFLPNANLATPPPCPNQVAVAKQFDDPAHLGRITCSFLWDKGKESPWLKLINTSSGKDKQTFMQPSTHDLLLIGFENNHPERPFVYGSFFHGGATAKNWDKDEIGFKFGDLECKSNKKTKKSSLKFGAVTIEINHQSGEIKIDATQFTLAITNKIKMSAKALIEITAKLIRLN